MKTTVHRAVHDARSDYFHIGYEPIVVHADEIIRYHVNPAIDELAGQLRGQCVNEREAFHWDPRLAVNGYSQLKK